MYLDSDKCIYLLKSTEIINNINHISVESMIGILSIIAIIYCVFINALHFRWSYKKITKIFNRNNNEYSDNDDDKISIIISLISIIFITICPLILLFSYWIPYISNNHNKCLCRFYFSSCVICYLTSQYSSKLIYIYKAILIHNKIKNISISIKISIFLLIISYLIFISLIITFCDGSCYLNKSKLGCKIKINGSNIIFIIIILIIDALIYSKVCYESYKILKNISFNGRITSNLMQQFMTIFIGTTSILLLSIITITTNTIWIKYETLNILIIDCMINITIQIYIYNFKSFNKFFPFCCYEHNRLINDTSINNNNQQIALSTLSMIVSSNSANIDEDADDDKNNKNNINDISDIEKKQCQRNLYPIHEKDDDELSINSFSDTTTNSLNQPQKI